MVSIIKRNYLLVFIYLFAALITFGKLPFSFFLQDEWLIIGTYLHLDKANIDWLHKFFIYEQLTHLVPFTHLVSYSQFELFRINFFLYGAVAIAIHFVNALLVCHLSFLLLRIRFLSFVSGFLFLISSISHQGFTWIATTIGTAFSALFLLLCLIFFTRYLNDPETQKRTLLLSALFLTISLLFKEISIFGFLFLAFFWFIYKRKDFIKARMALVTFFPFGIIYLAIRIINLIIINISNTGMETAFAQPGLEVYLFRIFTLPLRFISQGILPQEFIINLSNMLVNLAYPVFKNSEELILLTPHIIESVGADIVSYFFSVIVICISIFFIISYKKKEENLSKIILLSLIFICLSSFPFILIPGRAGYNSLIDGRHFYVTEIFTSILLTSIGFSFYLLFRKSRVILIMLIVSFMLFSFYNIMSIRNRLHENVLIGNLRKGILEKISSTYPDIPQEVIFYIESDKAYYGLPPEEKILPFQSGFGQTLLVWYNEHGEAFPACFFEDQYLYVQESEGYRECGGRGFGFFRKMESLKSAIQKQNINAVTIIGFSYSSSTNTLSDVTEDIRKELKQ
ncbi:MAG: hypothetical protein Q8P26_04335 [Candidatus Levybacteria bacterium]|nr:hypothetical protein [Candidatus Levybacteria bacterium]